MLELMKKLDEALVEVEGARTTLSAAQMEANRRAQEWAEAVSSATAVYDEAVARAQDLRRQLNEQLSQALP